MANKLNITKGNWKGQQQTNGDIHISTTNWFNFLKVSFVHDANTKEHREQCLYNSELITDAQVTHTKRPTSYLASCYSKGMSL